MVSFWQRSMAQTIISFLLMLVSHAAEVQVTLDSNEIAVGEAANLTLRVTGGKAQQPNFPAVPNLTIQFQGQSQMISIVNGVTTQAVTYNYIVGSQVAGTYVIPSIAVNVSGQAMQTQAQNLTVVDDGTAKPQNNPLDPAANDPNYFGLLQVELAVPERKEIYLGEIAPVRIQALFSMDAQVRLDSGLQPENSSFTLHNVSPQPQQTVENKNGKQYRALTWFGGVSGTKAGIQPVNLSLKVVVARPDPAKPVLRPRQGNRQLQARGVSFVEEDVTLKNQNMSLNVRPLPEEGRPQNFSGAVGEFAFDILEIPTTWITGEPQRVALRVKGSGNFAIMKAPELSPADLWKWYPGQDQFTPGDVASFSGSKVFQYNALARKSGSYDVAFELSYFDPRQALYQTIRSQSQSVQITGDPIADETTTVVVDAMQPPVADDDGLAPLRESNRRSAIISQLSSKVNIPAMVAVMSFLCATIPLLAFWYRRKNDPHLKEQFERKREINAAMAQAEQSIHQNNAAAYWQSARRTVQLPLAAKWQVHAHSITLHDVATRCGVDSPVTVFFREADRSTYGSETQQPQWESWRALHQQALQALHS
jgi:hypothetical protein